MAELKDQITIMFNKFPREQVKLACTRFRPRLEKVIKSTLSRIEANNKTNNILFKFLDLIKYQRCYAF